MTSRSLPATRRSQVPFSEICFREEETEGLLSLPRTGIAPSRAADAPSEPRKPRRFIMEGYRVYMNSEVISRAFETFNFSERRDRL